MAKKIPLEIEKNMIKDLFKDEPRQPWSKLEKKVLIDFLTQYSQELSNNSCNDLFDDQEKLAEIINESKGEDDQIINDWQLVDYLIEKLNNVSTDDTLDEKKEKILQNNTNLAKISKLEQENKKLQKELDSLKTVKDWIANIKKM